MDRSVLEQNIALFRKLLETETDAAVRRTVELLLADAEAVLTQLEVEE